MPLIDDNHFLEPHTAKTINYLAIDELLRHCYIRQFPKKGVIVNTGETADSLFCLIKGSVKITVMDEDHNEVVLTYLNPGDFIGEIGLFYRIKHRIASVRARTPCEVAEIKYEHLDYLFKHDLKEFHADILSAIGLQLAQRLLKTTRRITQLVHMDVSGRVARIILDLCREPGAMSHPEGTQIHVSRQEIARMAGCSRETVGRILRQMAEDGMVDLNGMDIVIYHSR
ncbi:MAG: cyclic nucleotide-binding domain-containing protein [Gammaproteobacteria bacterium]|nr:cyclic nucleotide-binding domain-containing protein [Gammaproteobacteria bacterium]